MLTAGCSAWLATNKTSVEIMLPTLVFFDFLKLSPSLSSTPISLLPRSPHFSFPTTSPCQFPSLSHSLPPPPLSPSFSHFFFSLPPYSLHTHCHIHKSHIIKFPTSKANMQPPKLLTSRGVRRGIWNPDQMVIIYMKRSISQSGQFELSAFKWPIIKNKLHLPRKYLKTSKFIALYISIL